MLALLATVLRRPVTAFVVGILALALSDAPRVAAQQNLTDAQIAIVVERLAAGATHSWEFGTREQALIELDTPSFSVFNNTSLPPSKSAPGSLDTVLDLIAEVVVNRTKASGGLTGPQPLVVGDGSAADPASNGVAALIANWTGQSNSSIDFGQAATDQMNYLWASVPRTSDGALSHRVSELQLWSDFVYMVPPFLAYYGVMTENRSMVEAAYTQISLYRNYLRDESANNLWKHVVMGSDFQDEGHWSTGNGWAAAGMLRVLGTIKNSQYSKALKGEVKDLTNWVNEIHDGMYQHIRDDNLFNNYADNGDTFADASSAALLAATVYRTALLTSTYRHLPTAEAVRKSLWSPSAGIGNSFVDASTLTNMTHFSVDGWLTPVVNPDSFGDQGSQSPEGQAFVIEMYAAWRDWVQNGAVGANGAHIAVAAPAPWTLAIVSFIAVVLSSGWSNATGYGY
ncbi:hypothetical protein M0805_007630 [Coniferiporia weirii]|nr:hypothetical protein M0805_007630 [Coniferiporia weirii]